LQRLKVLPSLINQAVGDALSDLLLVDAILHIEGMTVTDWNNMYTDLPSRQLKVQVQDRSCVKVNDNETVCLEPAAVQTALDAAMADFHGRAFVRPSGTEDVVRIYAEAADREAADGLAAAAAAIVYRLCDGVGEAPPVFPASRM
jgi:phosphoacetylglucosamine mutase